MSENDGVWINGIWVDRFTANLFEAARRLAPYNVLLTGPSGLGKTSIPTAFGREWGYRVERINCANVRDPEEWFGVREARLASTRFITTRFTEAVTTGNAVIILDEFNRLEPWISNSLFPLLDEDRETHVHGLDIAVGPNVIFCATVNVGVQYAGTFALDAALVNRMGGVVEVYYLQPEVETSLLLQRSRVDEDDAAQIVSIMTALRGAIEDGPDLSTRVSLKIARLVSVGLSIKAALGATVINVADPRVRREIADVVAEQLMGESK